VTHPRNLDIILTDVYMPQMNGFKLLMEVKNRFPDMPVLMMTGYNSAAKVLSSVTHSNVEFMSKPFRLSELGETVKSMIS